MTAQFHLHNPKPKIIACHLYFHPFLLQIDLQLHCDEWDKLLSSGHWEPEVILQKLPEFLQFVKDVQGFVTREMQSRLKGKINYLSIH